ncbi:MAG: hypothetical protein PVG70_13580 [Desulfobacterales bacterium]|jgi:hypothetical protein
MDSPLARVILAVLGGYFIILLFLIGYEWFREEYPRPAANPESTERIQYPFYHELATTALQRFSRLSKPERDAIKESLEASLISMEQWLTHLDQSDYQVICIGELHEESTRNFLAEEFFTKFSVDVLLLEATPKELRRLIERMNAGRTYFPLLDADIMKILRTVRATNSDIKICGIEETDEQQKKQRGHSGSRDRSIARNFWKRFQPGMRHLILFGAIHCTNEPHWLFEYLHGQAALPLKKRMLNAWVLGEHQNGPLEAFLFFLDMIGIQKKNFVIPDTNGLHPRIYELFQLMTNQILEKYCTLIVFRV